MKYTVVKIYSQAFSWMGCVTNMSALHTPMIQGKYKNILGLEEDDLSTINFIIEIIKGNITGTTGSTTLSAYGITKTMPQTNSLGWIEGFNDERINLSFDLNSTMVITDIYGNIIYSEDIQAPCVSVQEFEGKREVTIERMAEITVTAKNDKPIDVTYAKAGNIIGKRKIVNAGNISDKMFNISISNNSVTIK